MEQSSEQGRDEKHERYFDKYIPNDTYWAIGIECENYIEIEEPLELPNDSFMNNRKMERYSVNYWRTYRQDKLKEAFARLTAYKLIPKTLPRLINAHTLQKTDRLGQHKTTYEVIPQENKKFNGRTIFDHLQNSKYPDVQEVFRDEYTKTWCFDGDTIEVITQDFYKTTVTKCVDEFKSIRARWISAFQKCMKNEIGPERWLKGSSYSFQKKNHGFAVFHTNRSNVTTFNNGTYHINMTLPTELNENGEIADFELFTRQHCRFARMFQWLSPLLIAKLGTPDPFSSFCRGFPKGSQRLTVSRYAGIANYNTDKMERGKLLLVSNPAFVVSSSVSKKDDIPEYYYYHWMTKLYNALNNEDYDVAYELNPMMGVDINFNKFKNHGLEFRIFDYFEPESLPYVLELLVYAADHSLNGDIEVPNPLYNQQFHTFVANILMYGDHDISQETIKMYNDAIKLNIPSDNTTTISCTQLLSTIYQQLKEQNETGICAINML